MAHKAGNAQDADLRMREKCRRRLNPPLGAEKNMLDDNAKEVMGLLDGIESGKLRVVSYSSQWQMKGMKPTNRRKMTILVEEVA
jgi:hypothetical protein